jgi:signal transduction histidine kinase
LIFWNTAFAGRVNLAEMWNNWVTARRLQTQLLLWTALILIASVGITFEVSTRLNLRMLEENLRDRAETLVRAVDRAVLGGVEESRATLERRLDEFVDADRTLTRLDVLEIRGGQLQLLASSSRMPDLLVTSAPAATTTEIRSSEGGRDMVTMHPVPVSPFVIVAVTSLENIDRYEAINRGRLPLLAVSLITIVIVLMNLMYRRTVSRRFDELLRGIRQAKDGNFTEPIPDARQDEIGIIANTLNSLLTQVRSFNEELQRQVASATDSLNRRNLALEETTRQMVSMQHQLLQSERMATVGQMAATFAHEIGSPMSSLSAHAQLLLEDPRLSRDQRETLGLIREQIQSVVQIVNDLLRSARRGPNDFVPTDVNEIIQAVLRLTQPKLMSQKIVVEKELQTVPLVRAYPLYLQEVFLNLINNALDAMPGGGNLEVRSWFDSDSQRVQVRIADTGPGIDPEVVEHLFDHFVTTKAMGNGTGLGLGIVKDIVDGHRGTVVIAPNNGRGTAAHITLPADAVGVRV